MNRNRQKQKANKKSIDIMDLLAIEATADSRKLLKQYGQQDATGYSDLKNKLTQLYYNTSDKAGLEKQMVEIHPHRKWILKYTKPTVVTAPVIEEVKVQQPTKEIIEQKASCDACNNGHSHFDAQAPLAIKDNTPLIVASLVTLAIVAIALKRN